MTTSSTVQEVARQFARAIDVEDYRAAGKLLAGACIYAFRGRRMVGRDKILDSFAQSEEWTKRTFDEVCHDNSVQLVSETMVRVRYIDDVTCDEQRLHHQSEQLLEVDPERGVITHITHVDLPGETQKLDLFMRRCGLG